MPTTTPSSPAPAAKLPLSVAIVCKNSAATIGLTLQRIAPFASEIIAFDSGSTDGTLELLAQYNATVHRVAWMGYVKTKQAALQACTQDWILCLDSDESPEADLAASISETIRRATANPALPAGYELNRKVWYAGRFLNHAWQQEWRLRLVRRGSAHWTGIDPHDKLELLAPNAPVGRLTGDLRHDSIATFAEFLAKQCQHGRLMAQGLHARGKRGSLFRLLGSPPIAFAKQLIIKQAFLDGWRGWLAAAATATAALAKHAALIELDALDNEKHRT